MSSNNKVQVKLTDGTIGVPDKFIVGKVEYNTQSEAELAVKTDVLYNIRAWFDDWTSVDSYRLSDDLHKLDKATINKLIELLVQLT